MIPLEPKGGHVPILSRSRSGPVVDVGTMLSASASEYIASIITSGALVSLFRTRDAGAFGCQVTFDGDTEKEYFRGEEEFTEWLKEVDDALTAIPAPPPQRKRAAKGA